MLSIEQKEVIKATVPVLRENGVLLTRHFYDRMLNLHPDLKNTFNMGNQQNGKQQTALAMAVLAYAENIDNPAVLMPVINGIGNKHVSLNIQPEQYAIVGENLLASIQEVLGEAATPAIIEAWGIAYGQLAAIMSGHEQGIYKAQREQAGGWNGWKKFVVKEKIKESAEITSFYLYPVDGTRLPDFKPGQYLSVRLYLPQLDLLQPRQYSISNAPNGEYYRISVKKEAGNPAHPDGMISNRLHDFVQAGTEIEVSAPAGNFTLQEPTGKDVVFISGGVGQTPLISMLESLIANGSTVRKTWIHGCREHNVHAFKDRIAQLNTEHNLLDTHLFYNDTESETHVGLRKGWVDLRQLDLQDKLDADFYICGPAAFIKLHYTELVAQGVKKEQIYYEEFGPLALNLN